MHRTRRIAAFLAAIITVAALTSLTGCSDDSVDNLSKTLSTYTITAEYDDSSHTLSGSMTLKYTNSTEAELSELPFHLYGAAYREGARYAAIAVTDRASAYPNGVNYGGMTVQKVLVNSAPQTPNIVGSDDDILSVAINDKLLPGATVEIAVDFEVKLANVRHRLGWYDDSVNLGNFYPVACVYERGGFRTDPYYNIGDPFYSDAANYEVTLTVPKNYVVACTGTAQAETAGETQTVRASAKAVRDFAIALGNYQTISKTVDGVTVRYFHRNDPSAEASLNTAAKAVETFGKLYGKYPYSDFTVARVPLLQGGMEYPGLALVSDALSASATTDAIVHETAHQWWYAAVGSDEINSPWQDEALAEYSATLFFRENPEYGVDFEKRIADALSAYMLYEEVYKQGAKSDKSMNRPLSGYADAMEYTYMTYVKGQLMFDNLRRIIGDEKFFSALKLYYAENRFKIAVSDSLIGAFEKASERGSMSAYFNSWLGGKTIDAVV